MQTTPLQLGHSDFKLSRWVKGQLPDAKGSQEVDPQEPGLYRVRVTVRWRSTARPVELHTVVTRPLPTVHKEKAE